MMVLEEKSGGKKKKSFFFNALTKGKSRFFSKTRNVTLIVALNLRDLQIFKIHPLGTMSVQVDEVEVKIIH